MLSEYALMMCMQPYSDGGLKNGQHARSPKNFLTGPGKKGGYGFNKTTLSERQGYKGVVGCGPFVATSSFKSLRVWPLFSDAHDLRCVMQAGEYAYASDPVQWNLGHEKGTEKGNALAFKPPQLNSKGPFAKTPVSLCEAYMVLTEWCH